MGRVVHCKREQYDVYIGRPSKWQNIFSHKKDSAAEYLVSSREESLELFEAWLMEHPDAEQLRRDIGELKGKVLGCWCAPKHRCHGEILMKLAERAASGTSTDS